MKRCKTTQYDETNFIKSPFYKKFNRKRKRGNFYRFISLPTVLWIMIFLIVCVSLLILSYFLHESNPWFSGVLVSISCGIITGVILYFLSNLRSGKLHKLEIEEDEIYPVYKLISDVLFEKCIIDNSRNLGTYDYTIDERIAQQCRELKKEFDEIENCKNKYPRYVKMSMKTTYEKQAEFYRTGIQERYSSCFGNNIIPFNKSGETLERNSEIANKKEPPFLCNKDASDKGFKDCLLWFSILDYFKEKGEDEVVFLTDDKHAFRNFIDFLSDEFESETGKVIEFKPNSYYKDLFKKEDSIIQEKEIQKEGIPNIEEFRVEVENVIDSLRCINYENYYGDPQWDRTFTTSVQFDKEYVKTLFEGLHEFIVSHIFEKSVPATKIFGFDGRVSDGNIEIPLKNLESALDLYQKVVSNYPQYKEQFFEATSKILNQNYVAPNFFDIKDDDLPF